MEGSISIERTVLVNIDHMLSTTDRGTVAIGGIVVATIELVEDEGRAVAANVLDLGQLVMRHDVARWVARVGG